MHPITMVATLRTFDDLLRMLQQHVSPALYEVFEEDLTRTMRRMPVDSANEESRLLYVARVGEHAVVRILQDLPPFYSQGKTAEADLARMLSDAIREERNTRDAKFF